MLKNSQQYLCDVQKFFLFPHFNMNFSNCWFHSEHNSEQDKVPGRKKTHTFTFGSAATASSKQLTAAEPLNSISYHFPGNLSIRVQGLLKILLKTPFCFCNHTAEKNSLQGENSDSSPAKKLLPEPSLAAFWTLLHIVPPVLLGLVVGTNIRCIQVTRHFPINSQQQI